MIRRPLLWCVPALIAVHSVEEAVASFRRSWRSTWYRISLRRDGSAAIRPAWRPGVALNLPFSVYFFRRAARERWFSRRALRATAPAAALIHGPGLIGLLLLAGLVAEVAAH